VGAILLACCFDLAASQSALQFASNYFFAALQHGNMAMLAACFILALSLWGLAYQRLRTQLYLDLKF